MMNYIENIIADLTNTSMPRWRVLVGAIFLAFICISTVFIFLFMYFAYDGLSCHSGYASASVLWLVLELAVIFFLIAQPEIPMYARTAITLSILLSNCWLILFVFSLKECA